MNSLKKMIVPALLVVLSSSVVTAHGGSNELIGAATNSAYLKECGACHLAYQPQFLPKRSWEKIMATLDSHFGDSAALDDALKSEILGYLAKNSADASSSKISRKMLDSLGSETPLRITDTPYFKRKHREVRADVFKRKSIGSPANCTACHLSADKGDYNEHKVKIPRS